jgi:hypothetical protein
MENVMIFSHSANYYVEFSRTLKFDIDFRRIAITATATCAQDCYSGDEALRLRVCPNRS